MIKKRWATKKADSSKESNENKAFNACVRRLTRRDYSVKELRTSMGRWYTPEAIDAALAKAQHYGYLKEPTEISAMWAKSLMRKGRGLMRVNYELKKRGLPAVSSSHDEELERCRLVYQKKFGETRLSSQTERAKAMRYLTARGFDTETIRKVVLRQDVKDSR